MIKKIIFISASFFLIWQSYDLIIHLDSFSKTSLTAHLFLAFIINIYLLGIFAFSGFALPSQKLLPNDYYQIKNDNLLLYWYNLLQVNLFRIFLLHTFWKNKKQQKGYFNGKLSDLDSFSNQSKKSEFGHITALFTVFLITIYLLYLNIYKAACLTTIINIFANLYPVILQRHHRQRIQKIKKLWIIKNA